MVEETPSRMSVGAYRILNDDEEMEISPVMLRASDTNNVTIDGDEYSPNICFRNRSSLQAIDDDDDDSAYMHFTFSQEPSELNGLNYLNFVTLCLHLFVSCGIGMWGLDGLMNTHLQVMEKYETLVTPAEWASWIWIPILFFETLFALAQLFPSFRSRPILQESTGYFFFYTCLLQAAWTISFSFHVFIASFILAVATLVSCASLLIRQHYSRITRSRSEYWLFRSPFFLLCGWMLVMVVVNASMLCRSETSSISTQLTIALVGLSVLLPLATTLLWFSSVTDFCIPSIIIYYYIAIAWRLRHEGETLLNDYGKTIVDTVELLSFIFAGIVMALLVPRLLISVGHKFLTIQVVTMQEDSLTLE